MGLWLGLLASLGESSTWPLIYHFSGQTAAGTNLYSREVSSVSSSIYSLGSYILAQI